MFTDKAQTIIDITKNIAFTNGHAELKSSSLLTVIGYNIEAGLLLAECLAILPDELRSLCPEYKNPISCPGKLPVGKDLQDILSMAKDLASLVPDRSHPGLIDIRHIVCALAMADEIALLLKAKSIGHEQAILKLSFWYENDTITPRLDELTERLRKLRTELFQKIFGQDHTIHAFVEGLFNAEVVATADTKRKAPRAIFIFAGPPGVGKTFLAETGASFLDRPFKRFDMSSFSGHQQNEALVGMAKSFHGAHPGILTEFVEKNPNAILLFDEMEKAHQNTIFYFLQILDAGRLEDKYHERDVQFRDTIIIFTTNAGKKLYDRPNTSGVHSVNSAFHRRTIIDALSTELNPQTNQPFFPAAICSRMATGYPVLFNHLRVNELEKVARAELTRVTRLFEMQYYKRVLFEDIIPMCLVLREGTRVDARSLRAQVELFVKTEIFKLCQLFKTDRLEDVFSKTESVRIGLDNELKSINSDVSEIFQSSEKPQVLIIADQYLGEIYKKNIPEIEWYCASSQDAALQLLSDKELDLVLLDLWLSTGTSTATMSVLQFDHVPVTSRRLDKGQELLKKIRDRLPDIPVYLLSLSPGDDTNDEGTIDEELFMACVRSGGARGMITSHYHIDSEKNEELRYKFTKDLLSTLHKLYREKTASKMGQEHKILMFDTSPQMSRDGKEITIRLRNLNLCRAVAAADAGEILEEVERPRVMFDDVIGADTAKEELKFFIDFLKNPRHFAALGLKPPKGVLLYGPPGTGKTMLARAMAGESNVAFISATASTFVTMWQGSGPQNVRDLFARARRYAPSIIFIDEIDAVGKVRTGGGGSGHGEEMALNALLTEMDGFSGPSLDKPVFVLAATNFRVKSEDQDSPERSARTLDLALVRRFSRSILVDLPDTAARKKYLLMALQQNRKLEIKESAIDLLAEKSVGMSVAELEGIVQSAARSAVKTNTEITGEMLLEVLDSAREGEAKEWSPEFLESTARHEAGHTIMYWLSGWISPEVSIVARADHGGGMRRAEIEIKKESLTRSDMLGSIRTALGGRAAEIVYYGKEAGLTTGASGDLEYSTNIARQIICRYGMDDDFGLIAAPEILQHPEAISSPIYQKVSETANKILKEEMEKTIKSLEENKEYLDEIAKELIKKNRIYRDELERILEKKI
jgi:ATP-dependent metalloprotease FtsH